MYTDIHTHILYDTDDGPSNSNEMYELLDLAYKDGVRALCVTPHFNFNFYGDNTTNAKAAFSDLSDYAREKYPNMQILLGNEIFYHNACTSYLRDAVCNTINNGKYVLVDFSSSEYKFNIMSAMKDLLGHGYIPILAHAERYSDFGYSTGFIEKLKTLGVIIQINAGSLIGKNGLRQKILSRSAVKKDLCDVIASDTHNLTDRKTCMSETAAYIQKKHGTRKVQQLMIETPNKILNNQRI